MTPNYKVVYNAANGERVVSIFHSIIHAYEFAALKNGIVLNNKEI